jgi:beta-lactam-binding protein with PASTA domain/tRNA A-37 threonylcarbamoyl transferase component Bud32
MSGMPMAVRTGQPAAGIDGERVVSEMLFGNRYRTTEKLGSGGMADVYKAMDEVLGRTVAVKVMHAHYSDDPQFVQRFRHEAQAAANLSHPNIVNIYDWGQQEDTYYIVMEYVRGTDLKALIQQRGPADPLKAMEYAAQVCSALSVAHGYGIIHRDIKSHNLVLTPDGTVKVMDFGIARAVNTTMTQTGSVLGTAQYVSPEQAQGRDLGPQTDLYSLGVVLYEMTTGKLPFDGETPVSVALKHVNDAVVPPRQIDPDIPPAVEAVIMRAMEKDPAKRYSSADQMRGDLLRAAQGRPVGANPRVGDTTVMPAVGPPTRTGDVRRTPVPQRRGVPVWVWVAVFALFLALGLGTAWALGLFGGTSVKVPAVAGMTEAAARTAIEKAGLKVGNVDPKSDDVVEEGKVVSTDPAIGASVPKGQAVDIVLSAGPSVVKVPGVVGLAEAEAISALQAAGFDVALPIIREFTDKYDAGFVSQQEPLANSNAAKASKVTLYVSKGVEMVPVPYVVDKSKADAITALQKAGFTVTPKDKPSPTVPVGKVIEQAPPGGGKAPSGSEVVIFVSTGPEMVVVPDVYHMKEVDAKAKLISVGLVPNPEVLPAGPPLWVGFAIDQNPAAGVSVIKGSTVWIQIGG